ncbi:M20/M25/M40 family metallo-hydrolase [Pseudomonas sp. Z5-35]|uniref:M20 family metallopeptidase n=1 Tax=unclassified Pseudomonas TaxID=196821 RepID=UPI003DA9F725
MFFDNEFDSWFRSYQAEMLPELIAYLSIDTSCGNESDAIPFLTGLLERYGFNCCVENYHSELCTHSARTSSDAFSGKINLRAKYEAESLSDEVILFNSHIDVVPVEGEGAKLLTPWLEEGYIYGRGACDTKGNLFLLLGALAFLKYKKISHQYKVRLDLVSEEEVGGNGTLSTILHGVLADLVIVFEPTDLAVHRGHRGCLTCEATIIGKSVHMGSDSEGLSAINVAVRLMEELKKLEHEMLADAKGDPAFSIWKRPLQINIGKILGGEWPGTVPERCNLVFNVGFLPKNSMIEIETILEDLVRSLEQVFLGVRIDLNFHAGLRNKAYLESEDNSLLRHLGESISISRRIARGAPIYAWRASCDARHYAHEANVPTAIFGAGSLGDAHSSHERIEIDQMRIGIKALSLFLMGPNAQCM